MRQAKFMIGDVVRHRLFPFRGVIFDVDPEFANTEEWWLSIPEEIRPHKDQPFYHLLRKMSRISTRPMSPNKTCCPTPITARSVTPTRLSCSPVLTANAMGSKRAAG
jgi:hypothetical protein